MDEYLLNVLIDDHKETLKTYATSVYSAVDNIVAFDFVQDIFKVVKKECNTTWHIKDMDLDYLRMLRDNLDKDSVVEYLNDEALNEYKH